MENTTKRMGPTQIAGMLFLLVILPAGTWFYLYKGYQHRKESLKELEAIGPVGAFERADQYGKTFSSSHLHNRVTVAGFLPDDAEQKRTWTSRLLEIQTQFDHRDDICFLLFADTSQIPDLQAFALEQGLSDTLQWELLRGAKEEWDILSAGFYLPDTRHIAIIDTGAVVRRTYDILDNKQMGRMIEHLTILMPKSPDPDIEFRRDREK
jgi:hypothetical protein